MLIRIIAALLLAFLVAFPARAMLLEPDVAWAFKLAWLLLVAGGIWRPSWSPAILVIATPLSPILPATWPAIPAGIIHLTIVSQALPFLTRLVLGRTRLTADPVTGSWALLVMVALLALAVPGVAYLLAGGVPEVFGLEAQWKATHYVFEPAPSMLLSGVVSCTVLLDGLLVAAMVRALTREGRARHLLAVVAVGAGIVATVGILQSQMLFGLSGAWQFFDPGIVRVNATYTDPNALAAYFAMATVIIAGLVGGATGWRRAVWLLTLGVVLLALVMTAGRMGLLAAIAGLGLLIVAAFRLELDRIDTFATVRRRARRLAGAVAVLLVLLGGTTVLVGTALDVRHEEQTSYVRTWLYTFNLRQPPDLIAKGRLEIWRVVGRMIGDQPVFGVGPGRIFEQFPLYVRPDDRWFTERTALSAHSTFLSIAAELGVAGSAAWLLLLFAVYRSAFDARALVPRTSSTWPALGLAGGLVAFGLTMMTGDRTVLREDVALFAAMGGLAALNATGPWVRWPRRLIALAMALVVVTHAARAVAASRGIDVTETAFGVYGVEHDHRNVPFRWTSGRALLPVPAEARRLMVPIRKLAPMPQHVRVWFDGRLVEDAVVTADGWRHLRYDVPPASHPAELRYLRIDVAPTWQEPPYIRALGVMLGEMKME